MFVMINNKVSVFRYSLKMENFNINPTSKLEIEYVV